MKAFRAKRKPATVLCDDGMVVLQARISSDFARKLFEEDAPALGLHDHHDELLREALRLLHAQAGDEIAARSYEEFYDLA